MFRTSYFFTITSYLKKYFPNAQAFGKYFLFHIFEEFVIFE